MHTYYRIAVKPDYRWSNVRVAGRSFSKSNVEELNEAEVNDEILNSPLLSVEEVVELEPEKPKRTRRKANADKDG